MIHSNWEPIGRPSEKDYLNLQNLSINKNEMDINLHVEMAVKHIDRALKYAQFVVENNVSEVFLTEEDWQVVADALFRMGYSDEDVKSFLPDLINEYSFDDTKGQIILKTNEMQVELNVIA